MLSIQALRKASFVDFEIIGCQMLWRLLQELQACPLHVPEVTLSCVPSLEHICRWLSSSFMYSVFFVLSNRLTPAAERVVNKSCTSHSWSTMRVKLSTLSRSVRCRLCWCLDRFCLMERPLSWMESRLCLRMYCILIVEVQHMFAKELALPVPNRKKTETFHKVAAQLVQVRMSKPRCIGHIWAPRCQNTIGSIHATLLHWSQNASINPVPVRKPRFYNGSKQPSVVIGCYHVRHTVHQMFVGVTENIHQWCEKDSPGVYYNPEQ